MLINSVTFGGEDGILDQVVVDGHQAGMTYLPSATVRIDGIVRTPGELSESEKDTGSDLQIKYSGDAEDFVDTDDHITRDARHECCPGHSKGVRCQAKGGVHKR